MILIELTGNEDRPQFDKFMWERKEKNGRLRNYSGERFAAIRAAFTEGSSATLAGSGRDKVAAGTITSTPKKNSALADVPGRTVDPLGRRS